MTATTTLPLTSYQTTYNTSDYEEFGAYSIPPKATLTNNWDEEVAPALRKRLQKESIRVDQRIDQHNVQQRSHPPTEPYGRQNVKPTRRGEVLQDGLGSDDLIPSEWATGSSAQFTAISPRSRVNVNDKSRPLGTSQHHTTWQSNVSSYLAPRSPSRSPSSASDSPPISLARDSPSPVSPLGTQNISQAREKARRLAREREMQAFSHQLQSSTQEGDSFGDVDWQRDALNTQASQSIRDGQRNRTVSSPTVHNTNKYSRPEVESSQAENPCKESLPTSNSMPMNMNGETSVQDIRKVKSVARLTPKAGRGAQQERTDLERRAAMNSSPLHSIGNDTSISQDILDEFGPLGGIPRRKKSYGCNVEEKEEGGPGLINSRSVSNPWDEELLPTVKRRLAQEKMLAEMGRDDELVDTWDRHGLPLSKRRVSSSRQKVRTEREDGDTSITFTPSASPSKIKESTPVKENRLNDEGAQRMTRLHEQLNLGLQPQSLSAATSMIQHEDLSNEIHEQDRQMQQIEMSEIKHETPTTHQQQLKNHQPEHQSPAHDKQRSDGATTFSNRKQDNRTVSIHQNETAKDVHLAEVVNAGCCKCIVM